MAVRMISEEYQFIKNYSLKFLRGTFYLIIKTIQPGDSKACFDLYCDSSLLLYQILMVFHNYVRLETLTW